MDFIHKYTPGKLPVTVLLLHGSGGDENDLLPVARGLAPGAAFLSPRGHIVQHGLTRFFPYPSADGFDAEGIADCVEDLAEWLSRVVMDYSIDPARLYALGYSNGANMAAAMMLLKPGTIAGACLFRSRAAVKPTTLPDLTGVPVLISAGQMDHLIPAIDAQILGALLSQAGATVDLVIQNAGHELTPADFSLGKQWFTRVLTEESR